MRVDASSKESNIIRKLNFTFLYAKYYLHNQKLIHGELSVNEFIVNLKHKYIFEKFESPKWWSMSIGMYGTGYLAHSFTYELSNLSSPFVFLFFFSPSTVAVLLYNPT